VATVRIPDELMQRVSGAAKPGETPSEAARRLLERGLDPLESIWTVEEAAAAWGLHPGWVRKLCAKGKIQARQLGRGWIIPRDTPAP